MGRFDRLFHPRMRDEKHRGDWAEAAFSAKAMGQGLTVCRPMGENEPFDFVVYNVRRAMNRVQVKSAWKRWRGKYQITSGRGGFKRADIDFVVVAIPDADVWYVIPVDAIAGCKGAAFAPHNPKSKRKYEQYREAWHLLTGDEPGAWARYQRFTIHAGTE
ncbi:MAG TPA: group I intron-associated PD-(D/E)XK endonuclease [Terriglobales bacterium]|nr:group I intron-associated PD-(D/E)XK endonuclease [Terriglobales bacterium]